MLEASGAEKDRPFDLKCATTSTSPWRQARSGRRFSCWCTATCRTHRPADTSIRLPRAAEVHPGHRACLVAPTACHGPAGTPAGDGSGEQHARRPREQGCCMDAFAAEQSLRDAGLSSLMVLDTYSPITEVRCSNQSRDVISSDDQKRSVRRGVPCQHRHVSRLMALTISGRGVTAATAERREARRHAHRA